MHEVSGSRENHLLRHPAIFNGDWWKGSLGEEAEVVDGPSGLTRRSFVRNADFVVDNDDALVTSLTLSEQYAFSFDDRGYVIKTGKPYIGAVSMVAPGQATRICLEGRGRFLLLPLSVSGLRASIESDFEVAGERVRFLNKFGGNDPSLARAMFHAAIADHESADEALLAFITRAIHFQGQADASLNVRRSRSITPLRLRRVLEHVESELASPLTLPTLAGTAGISAYHFAREFHLATGYTPHQYVIRRRVDRAVELLADTRRPIGAIARDVGFYRSAHLARHMRRIFGLSASALRRLL